VLGFSELFADERYGPLNDRQHCYTHHIRTGGKHLLSLISDILDLSKIEARLGWFAHDRKSGGRGGRAQCNYQKIPRVTAPVVWPAPRLRRRPLWRVGQPPAERAVPVGFLGDLGPCCARLRHLR